MDTNGDSSTPVVELENEAKQPQDQNPQISSISTTKGVNEGDNTKDAVSPMDETDVALQKEDNQEQQPQEAQITAVAATTTTTSTANTKSAPEDPVNQTTVTTTSDNNNVSINDTKNEDSSSLMDTSGDMSQDSQQDSIGEEESSISSTPEVKPAKQPKKTIEEGNSDSNVVEDGLEDDSAQKEEKSPKSKKSSESSSATTTRTPSTRQKGAKQQQQQEQEQQQQSAKGKKPRNIRSELDRLLQDEGTVNLLAGGGRRGRHAPSASPADSPASKEAKLSELQKNRALIASQVREGSKTKLFNKVSLRQKSKSRRQLQQEEKDEKNKKAKLEPSSKIIRRRSSSSNFNFSSRSPSPIHPAAATIQASSESSVQVRVQDSIGYITVSAEAIRFNSQVTGRMTHILNGLKTDDSVSIVQLTTTNGFIQGLNIEEIRSEKDDSLRESMADSMIACLDTLLKALMNYPKILVAGVSGDAVDFGVILIGFFDLVYASDKATFQTNYTKNEYLPECLQFFPRNRLTNAMLYTGKKLTATEGLTSGLVTEVLWPAKFQAELASRVRAMSSSNQQGVKPSADFYLPDVSCINCLLCLQRK